MLKLLAIGSLCLSTININQLSTFTAIIAPPHIDPSHCVTWSESTVIDSNGDEWDECKEVINA